MHSDPSKKASIDSLLNPQHDSPYSLRAAFSWETSSKHVADLPPWPTHHDDRDPYAPPPTAWQSTERASVRLAARGTMSEHPSTQHDARYSTPLPSADYPQPHLNHSQYRFQSQYALQLNQTLPSPSLGPTSLQQPSSSSQPQPDTDSEPEGSNSASRKRSRPVSEGQAAEPQSKRAKGKSKPPADVATVQMMPRVSYAPVPSADGKENERMRVVTGDNGQINGLVTENAIPLQPELQFARCMSGRYRLEQFPRCVSCTRRWAGDTCRFQNIRFFLKDKKRDIVGISFVEGRFQNAPKMIFPSRWNISLTEIHTKRMKLALAKALLPILKKEHEHLQLPELIRRPRESEVRATCDTCMTSLSTCTWMCRLCGREACAECYEQVKELTVEKPNVNQAELAAIQARREKCVHINPFFLSCTRRNEHSAKDFSPVSRFFQEELDEAIPEMERLRMEEGGLPRELNPSGVPELSSSGASSSGSSSAGVPTPPPDSNVLAPPLAHKQDISSLLNHEPTATPPYVPPHLPSVTASVPSYGIRRYMYDEVSKGDSVSVFAPIWQRGEPIVVTGCLQHFKIEWTPRYFVEHYSEQTCLIIECQAGTNKRVTVSEFFNMFGKYEGRTECWKLKDWPPSTDFKTAFPELYRDFSNAVPVPDYVRRDGVANVGSHFPSNTIAPDLGPKMYNALASNLGEGSKGTTRLHLDMADAVNIMTYTEQCPDGTPGCAAWDIFRSSDSDQLRTFLHQKFPKQATDPIHGQQIYLDEVCRKELFDQFGIKSYRIYQRPGEAIFIPAGCAHQVANLADCVKVAIDFVSVENIVRCEELTREFRELNQKLAWKEDVLQLRNMMWFAWLSCGMFERGEVRDGSGEGEVVGGGAGGNQGEVGKGKKKGTRGRKRVVPNAGVGENANGAASTS
ncbi:hypothetical protein AGABI1DRAFT_79449 [Agaricus bisporus var. burnettii JB137-S8]|uniref:JmjC domain-containing protein n=1 Tax=Agaricus bisporus var. burnettii (strain JB137-S8 / ATCC MYA-4627 / FGSC 10392) TaxID=597362 RepID=K5VMP4_AGABU|nr:uncharacterized protein AGABI1DRAFT_79449 [Agaricus bisporus var. burnettii JB137-S8]EKM75704.1 hypothetical protein AGABI1DRAFT_79449 [Agaricus bisporus var. burnettii JB137-S8]